jgi:transcriptional regulator with XRE-family HTH domain
MEAPCLLPDTVRMAHTGGKWRKTFLREWRKHAGFKLHQAAAELGYEDHTQLSKIERGVSPYNQDIIEAAAQLYDCTAVDILARSPKEQPDLFTMWPRLTEEQKAYAAATLSGIANVPKRPQ